jgi:hypothetical protein
MYVVVHKNGVLNMKKFLLLSVCLFSFGLQASDCEFKKNIDQTLDLSGSEELAVLAGAGDLRITGVTGSDHATIKGRVCASEEKWLDQSGLETGSGKRAEIIVNLPDTDDGGSWSGNNYAYLDLELEVPEGIRMDVKDSSGDFEMKRVGAATVQDSSGDIDIADTTGPVSIRDSSGKIELSDINGDVTIESDSSGDIFGKNIVGKVLVQSDSSGDIEFRDVGEDFIVERDSSGDITAKGVGGNFHVLNDGSGEIRASNVEGKVEIPADKS